MRSEESTAYRNALVDERGEPKILGAVESYRIAVKWLDKPGWMIADWGCGEGVAQRYVNDAEYIGIDQFGNPHLKKDLIFSSSFPTDCILCRHVLEHNWKWEVLLCDLIQDFQMRASIVTFIPMGEKTTNTREDDAVPYLSLNREKFLDLVDPLLSHTVSVDAPGGRKEEIWLLEK